MFPPPKKKKLKGVGGTFHYIVTTLEKYERKEREQENNILRDKIVTNEVEINTKVHQE